MKRAVAILFALMAGGIVIAAGLVTALALSNAGNTRAQLAQQSELFETRHGVIEYLTWGEGPPVLVIHGAGGGFDQGRLLANAMGGTGFTWISVSRFGYLRSELPPDPSVEAQAEIFVDLLDNLGIDRVSVLAMSGGAPPALQLAANHPDRVSAMVLLSPAPFTPFSPDVEGRPIPTSLYTALVVNDVAYWMMTRFARPQLELAFDARPELLLKGADDAGFVRELISTIVPASGRIDGLRNEAAAVASEATYDLEAVRAPVLVVHAEDDRLNPVAVGETIAHRVPGASFKRLPSGGHLLLGHHGALRRDIPVFLNSAGVE